MINRELIQISFLRFTRKDMTVTSSLSSWISIAVTLISFNSEKIVESKTGKGVALTGTNNHSAADPGWSSGGVGPLYQTWGCNVSFTKTKICLTTGSHITTQLEFHVFAIFLPWNTYWLLQTLLFFFWIKVWNPLSKVARSILSVDIRITEKTRLNGTL